MVDESADHVPLRVTVSGRRTSAISVNIKIFVSSKFQPKAGTCVLCAYIIHSYVLRLVVRIYVNPNFLWSYVCTSHMATKAFTRHHLSVQN